MGLKDINFEELNKQLIEDGYTFVPIEETSILEDLKLIIKKNFSKGQEYYNNLERSDWHKIILDVQNIINKEGFNLKLIKSQQNIVKKILKSNSQRLGWVDVLKLRAIRPFKKTNIPDHVPFHRESFYASYKDVFNQYNYWTPITVSDQKCGLRIIPDSHKINEEEIIVEKDQNHYTSVERYSAGHAIGYPYAPKLIKNLNQLTSKQEKVVFVPKNHSLLFSAMLIHGNGKNMNNVTRFSIDTGFIPEEYLIENKPLFAAKNRLHYNLI